MNTKNQLLYKKFKTSKNLYLYTTYSNNIIKIPQELWDIIDFYDTTTDIILKKTNHKYTIDKISKTIKKIDALIKANILNNERPEICSVYYNREDFYCLYNSKLFNQLILNLTNKCNLRCKYCVYSKTYFDERNHNNEKMNWDYAKKAIDFFIVNSASATNPSITFYGGEPFLEYNLLKNCIEYAYSQNSSIRFSFTTNGTLLKENVFEFLVKNNVALDISLDGPQIIHDANRKFINSKGTFEVIKKNLIKLKEDFPKYYLENISFKPVISPPYNFSKITDYFLQTEIFKGKIDHIQFSPVKQPPGKETLSHEQYTYQYKKALKDFKTALVNKNYDSLNYQKSWLEKYLIGNIHFRSISPLKNQHPSMGQCHLGLRRLFVNTSGQYFMCEKVGEHFCIGDVNNGLYLDKIFGFYKKWDEFFSSCSNCWALRLCTKCFDQIRVNEDFDITKRESFCKSTKKNTEILLSTYCETIEQNPKAFDCFKPENFFKINKGGFNV